MIAYLEGKVIMRGNRFLLINISGVGYKVFSLPRVLESAKKNNDIKIWTHLRVKEDAMELYGFMEYPELEFFEVLIQISGVGPKSAMGILSIAPLDTLKKAIASGEISYLTKVSGVGKKTAERVIVELKDKMGELGEADKTMFKEEEDVLAAIVSLGYSAREAKEALKKLPESIKGINARVKETLKILGGK